MVPTEVLARQHYESIVKMFETAGISCSVALLTGSVTAASKRKIYEKIASHEVDIVVGTHALIDVYKRQVFFYIYFVCSGCFFVCYIKMQLSGSLAGDGTISYGV